jgi:hypothetical protein
MSQTLPINVGVVLASSRFKGYSLNQWSYRLGKTSTLPNVLPLRMRTRLLV